MGRLFRVLGVFLAFLTLISCGEGGGPQILETATDHSGPAGGTITLPSGSSVSIPAGILSEDTLITLRSVSPPEQVPSGFERRGPLVELHPDGLTFSQPVFITLPSNSPDLTNRSDLIYTQIGTDFRPASTEMEDAESHGQLLNSVERRITILASHFSTRQVLGRPDIENIISTCRFATPCMIPVEVDKCKNCSPRTVPITRIIIHSTNDKPGTTFPGLIAWILGSIGGRPEAFFATYYIDKEGRIIQLVDDNIETAHISCCNRGSIGIELFDVDPTYTDKQIQALEILTTQLMQKHIVASDAVLRHKYFTQDSTIASNAYHQDPYKWTDAGWNCFKSRISLPPILPLCTVYPPFPA